VEIAVGLTQAGKRAMAAAEARDPDALFEVGGEIYNVCVSCHQLYWQEGASRVAASSAPSSAKPPMKR
jgi:cytochrome c551/c552